MDGTITPEALEVWLHVMKQRVNAYYTVMTNISK